MAYTNRRRWGKRKERASTVERPWGMGICTLTLLTLLARTYARLKLPNVRPQLLGHPRRIRPSSAQQRPTGLRGRLHVQPRREGPVAGAAQHHGAHIGVAAQLREDAPELEPDGPREGVELLGPVDLHVRHQRRGLADEKVGVFGVRR